MYPHVSSFQRCDACFISISESIIHFIKSENRSKNVLKMALVTSSDNRQFINDSVKLNPLLSYSHANTSGSKVLSIKPYYLSNHTSLRAKFKHRAGEAFSFIAELQTAIFQNDLRPKFSKNGSGALFRAQRRPDPNKFNKFSTTAT